MKNFLKDTWVLALALIIGGFLVLKNVNNDEKPLITNPPANKETISKDVEIKNAGNKDATNNKDNPAPVESAISTPKPKTGAAIKRPVSKPVQITTQVTTAEVQPEEMPENLKPLKVNFEAPDSIDINSRE